MTFPSGTMIHRVDDGVGLAKGTAQTRMGQVDAGVGQRVGCADVMILRNMMNYHLNGVRPAREGLAEGIQTRMRQVDAL